MDLPAPYDNNEIVNINELTEKKDLSLSYVALDDAINCILKYGRGAIMNKFDLVDAFKMVPIKRIFGLYLNKRQDKYYFYQRLCFGCRSSPNIFHSLSSAVCWIVIHIYDIKYIIHLFDDILTVDGNFEYRYRTMSVLSMLFKTLFMLLSLKKTIGSVTELEYLGIT